MRNEGILMEIYEFLKTNLFSSDNYEIIEDSYGNKMETFLIFDDFALTFVFNNSNELKNVWKNDWKHLTSTALCGIVNITKGEESQKKKKRGNQKWKK